MGDDSDSDEVIVVHSDDEVMQQALVSMFCSKSISNHLFLFHPNPGPAFIGLQVATCIELDFASIAEPWM